MYFYFIVAVKEMIGGTVLVMLGGRCTLGQGPTPELGGAGTFRISPP